MKFFKRFRIVVEYHRYGSITTFLETALCHNEFINSEQSCSWVRPWKKQISFEVIKQ